MSCKRYEHWAGLYVGGDLDGPRARKLERHLADCADCRELVEGLGQTRAAMEGLRDESLDGSVLLDFRKRILEAIEAEADSTRDPARWDGFGKAWWRWGLVGSLALLLVALAVLFFIPRTIDSPGQVAEEAPPPKRLQRFRRAKQRRLFLRNRPSKSASPRRNTLFWTKPRHRPWSRHYPKRPKTIVTLMSWLSSS